MCHLGPATFVSECLSPLAPLLLHPSNCPISALPAVYIVFIGICCVLVAAIFIMTTRMVWYVHYCVNNEYYQGDLYFIIWMPLVGDR